jgi:hypothetical protein
LLAAWRALIWLMASFLRFGSGLIMRTR